MLKVQAFVPAAMLMVGSLFVLKTREQLAMPLARPLSTVLADLRGYDRRDQTIGAEERRVAGMSDYSARVWTRDSAVAFTTLVSYYVRQTQGKTIHSPRNCLPGAGWEIINAGSAKVAADGQTNVVNRYVLKNGPAISVVYYWYQGRGRIAANEYAVKWNLLRDAALLGRTEEALVRIVLPVQSARTRSLSPVDLERAYASADSLGSHIAQQLMHDVRDALPARDASPSTAVGEIRSIQAAPASTAAASETRTIGIRRVL